MAGVLLKESVLAAPSFTGPQPLPYTLFMEYSVGSGRMLTMAATAGASKSKTPIFK